MIRGGLVTLTVSDVAHAVRFYVETLGMKLVVQESLDEAVIDAGDGFCVGLRSGAVVAAPRPAVAFFTKVPLTEAVAIYENRGITFELRGEGTALTAHFHDPDGNALSLRASP